MRAARELAERARARVAAGRRLGLWVLALGAGCAPLPAGGLHDHGTQAPRHPGVVVTTERRAGGGAALVFVDESGRRISDVTRTRGQPIVDRQPAFAPGGQWIAFASNRGRTSPVATSLWVVQARSHGDIHPLTTGKHVDRDPVWDPDGRSLVFASDRDGSFDLYRLPIVERKGVPTPAGPPVRITRTRDQALAPSISPDGKWIVFMAVAQDGTSSLQLVEAHGGHAEQLTRGPTDVTPIFAPDGESIYFSARAPGRDDADIFVTDRRGRGRRVVVSEPDADQSGPRLTPDGKLLFATAVYRSQVSGAPVLASVVVAELGPRPEWRVLLDPAVVESRVGVSLAPDPIDRAVLARNPSYGEGLRRALVRALRDAAAEDARREHDPPRTGEPATEKPAPR